MTAQDFQDAADLAKSAIQRLGALLGAEAVADLPLGAAVIVSFGSLGAAPEAALAHPTLVEIGRDLEACGVYSRFMSQVFSSLPTAAGALGSRADLTVGMINGVFGLLRFPTTDAPNWSDDVFRLFVVPLMTAMIGAGRLAKVLTLEETLYSSYVKSRENATHFRDVYAQLAPIMAAGGRGIGRALAPLEPLQRRPRYRVAFIAVNLAYLAHVSTAIDIIDCIKSRPGSRIDCALVGLIAGDSHTITRCAELGIEIQTMIKALPYRGTAVDVFSGLRQFLAERGFQAAVWLSTAPGCAYAMGLRLAPVQIFFAMKYHSLSVPEIDAYLSGGPAGQRFNTIEGRRYRIGQTRYADLFEPTLAVEAERIRSELGSQRIILGCLGREDKINSSEFLIAVCQLLRAHPEVIFLWTGKKKLYAVQHAFEKAGVADRCIFIGWVDTRIYAQVLDIFLDSFPFPCGVTALQTMAAGKPVVFFDSAEARETGVPLFVQPVLEGEAGDAAQRTRYRELLQPDAISPLFPLARDRDHYVHLADALINDPAYRQDVGHALKSFVAEYITDAEACGRTYEAHIFEAIDAVATGDVQPAAQ